MKNNFLLLIITLVFYNYTQGQTNLQTINFGDLPKPVPSISSLSTYTENPSTISTGIPEISIPLFKMADINLVLSYNPLNASVNEASSEVGLGWTLLMGGTISREINGFVDEIFQSTTHPFYEKNEFNDIYFYDLPDFSGKFKIERNSTSNTFEIINLTPTNNIKIEYTKESNDATLVVNSFIITDDKGWRYYFNDFSKSALYGSFYTSKEMHGAEYKSAFFLTQIKDSNDIEIANFFYQKETKYNGDLLESEISKLNKISVAGLGLMEFTYLYEANLNKTMNDPYSLQKISLKNNYGNTIDQFEFDYSSVIVKRFNSNDTDTKRILDKISRFSHAQKEETIFSYYPNQEGIATSNILKKITYPTKGVTEYIYESGEVYLNKDAQYVKDIMQGWTVQDPKLQYTDHATLLEFNTENADYYDYFEELFTHTIIVPGDPLKKKHFTLSPYAKYKIVPGPIDPETGYPTLPPPLTDATKLKFTIKRGSEVVRSNFIAENVNIHEYPGEYTIEISKGYFEATGSIVFTELALRPPPYRNYGIRNDKFRIKSINYYKNHSDSIPSRYSNYLYDDFLLPNSSSGISNFNMILYKNVQISNGTTNGYTRYYYETPQDYPPYPYFQNPEGFSFWPYYNITKSGLLKKVEIYDANNQILSNSEYSYTFANVGALDYRLNHYFNRYYYSKPSWIKSFTQTSTVYPSAGQNPLKTESKIINNSNNFKIASSKETTPDGTTTETTYKYASDKNNQRLITANMTGVLLEIEKMVNTKTIAKMETEYENNLNFLPSSVITVNPNDLSRRTDIKYDLYDDRGNLIQYTTNIDPLSGQGNATTVIFGYNQTLPIAKITGAKLADIASLAQDIIVKSNTENAPLEETELMKALDDFRNEEALSGFLITTYTYDPLIGVTSVTTPNGQREIYKYDVKGRLESVIDTNGNIIRETKYNIK